jgi:predicted NBD/HSP70 family sugar kinase
MPGDAALGSLEALREQNRLRVVDALRVSGTATRSELARSTGLSRTTVASLVADLQDRGLVVEQRSANASGSSASRGRPAALLALDSAVGAAVGIDFGHRHVRVAVADLSSTVLAEDVVELDVDHAAAAALDAAVELVRRVIAESGIDRDRILGVGVGLASPIDRRNGAVGSNDIAPSWADIRPAEELSRRLNLPVEVDNDANIGALAEHSFGAGRGVRDLIYVQLRAGIGSGIIIGGKLHYGVAGFAGELGHIPVDSSGAVCRCGNRGCLETVASAEALVAALRPSRGDDFTVDGLIELVRAGDVGATRIVGEAGRAVGRVLAGLCNFVNPAAIVIGGDLAATGAPLIDGIRESIDRYALPGAAQAVEVKTGALGARAEVLGALALVIGNTERLRSAGLVSLRREEELLLPAR